MDPAFGWTACIVDFTIGPEQVVSGIRISLPALLSSASPTGSVGATASAGGLFQTGTGTALPAGALGLLLLAGDGVLVALERSAARHRH